MIGSSLEKDSVSVVQGVFVTEVDFTATPFDGSDRWIEAAVRPHTGGGSFVPLSPRQHVTSVPYATHALLASGFNGVLPVANGGTGSGTLNFVDLTNPQTVGGLKTFSQALATQGTFTLVDQLLSSSNSLELLAGGNRLYRLENVITPVNSADHDPVFGPNLIGGSGSNAVTSGVVGTTIGGGGSAGTDSANNHAYANRVTDDFGTVAGGLENQAGDDAGTTGNAPYATVSGGFGNTASKLFSTVNGGVLNSASGNSSTVSGGGLNTASGDSSVVDGGAFNMASGNFAIVSGGVFNTAGGDYSFAAGRRARATHQGAFVWGDSTDADVNSSVNNEFTVRATGGVRLFTNSSLQGLTIDTNGVLNLTNPSGGIKFPDNSMQTSAVDPANFVDLTTPQTIGGTKTFSQAISGSITGNAGTVTNGVYTVGDQTIVGAVTLKDQLKSSSDSLELLAGGNRLYRLENVTTSSFSGFPSPNLIGGSGSNNITSGVAGASIGGGGSAGTDPNHGGATFANRVTDDYGTVAGGLGNRAGDDASDTLNSTAATVGGGIGNRSNGNVSTVSGGYHNTANGVSSTVSGGQVNTAGGFASTVSGGQSNTAGGNNSTVSGGFNNTASGPLSFAAGTQAQAIEAGSFVWGDSNLFDVASNGANTFTARATGGVRFISGIDGTGLPIAGVTLAAGGGAWSSLSDRNMKNHFQPLDLQTILDKLANLPITEWSYKAQDPSIRHMGPMAQDFSAAFGLGEDDKHISTIDADGVMMAALQGLNLKLTAKDQEIEALKRRNAEMEKKNTDMEARLARLERLMASQEKIR